MLDGERYHEGKDESRREIARLVDDRGHQEHRGGHHENEAHDGAGEAGERRPAVAKAGPHVTQQIQWRPCADVPDDEGKRVEYDRTRDAQKTIGEGL